MVPDARVFSSMKNEQKYPWLYTTDKGSSSITDNMIILMVYLYQTLHLSDILFNQSIICRKVLISMYYVIFR
jgi:hypothetical protein